MSSPQDKAAPIDPNPATLNYAPNFEGVRYSRWAYLLVESGFAVGAAFAFLLTYGFWIEMMTRQAGPSGDTVFFHLYVPAIGCCSFAYGLFLLLFQDRTCPPLNRATYACLAVGVFGVCSAILAPSLYR